MKKILIIGAGGHGRVLAETARACGFVKIDFLDDTNPEAVGTLEQMETTIHKYDGVIVSIGNNDIREVLLKKLHAYGANIVTLIHPHAFVSPSARVGAGSIVLPMAVVNSNAQIGNGCIISIGALIDHDSVVDDYTHVNTGAIVCAGAHAYGKVEAGTVIRKVGNTR